MSKNRLASETSAYLLQHKENPVHWWAWGEEAFNEAKKRNKPVLLSIGYAACHWCHVMAHECFENKHIADVMNDLFVCIKLDREERPDIDKIYMTSLHELGEQGGWPLNMFLTPEGAPFWGGTYFPAVPKYGRPGFKAVLEKVSQVFHEEPQKVQQNTDALKQAIREKNSLGLQLDQEVSILMVLEKLINLMDEEKGGPKGAPKFPQTSLLNLFWLGFQKFNNARYQQFVITSLVNMSQGGIYDHLGGGYSRYSVDDRWLVPHFEKMLYDNAQLISLMIKTISNSKNSLFRCRIEETIGWLCQEMLAPEGAFYASLDADTEGEEGKYYVWQKTEIDELLTSDLRDSFVKTYDVDSNGNWEGKIILNRLSNPALGNEKKEANLAQAKDLLFKARSKRARPGLDDKILADWNGMLISALLECGTYLENETWVNHAINAYAFIKNKMVKSKRLAHSFAKGEVGQYAMLDDYAFVIKSALSLYELTNDPDYLNDALNYLKELDTDFWAEEFGAYYMSSSRDTLLISRLISASDEATPSGNAIMIENLVRIFAYTGNEIYYEKSEKIIHAFKNKIAQNIFAHCAYLSSEDFHNNYTEIIIIPSSKNSQPLKLVSDIYKLEVPHRIINLCTEKVQVKNHPAYGKLAMDNKDTFYICKNRTCSNPLTSLSDVRRFFKVVSEPNR